MLRLQYFSTTTIPVEAEVITPDHLAGKSAAEIAALPLQHGNTQVPLGEFFHVQGNAGDGAIVIEGDCSRVKWIGSEMTRGSITLEGNAGMHLGAEMRGGEIQVRGQAGDWVGAEMRGGRIHVHGNAGHLVGGAYRGSRAGMRGGVILVDGDAGNFVGVSMIAGSVFIFGRPGIRIGAGMKRGTIAVFGTDPPLLPTFRFDCIYLPVFMNLYFQQLRAWDFSFPREYSHCSYRRFSGDLVALGKGEILIRSQTSEVRSQ